MKLFFPVAAALVLLLTPSAVGDTVMLGAGDGTYSRPHPQLGTCSVPVAIVLQWDAGTGFLSMVTPTVRACSILPLLLDGNYEVATECTGDLLGAFSCYSTYYGSSLSVTDAGALTWARGPEAMTGTVTRTAA